MQEPARTPVLCAGVVRCLGCWEVVMSEKFEVVKRAFILIGLFLVAGWLVWCGNTYNDRNYSLIPAVMCAAESMLLMFIAVALMKRREESESGEF